MHSKRTPRFQYAVRFDPRIDSLAKGDIHVGSVRQQSTRAVPVPSNAQSGGIIRRDVKHKPLNSVDSGNCAFHLMSGDEQSPVVNPDQRYSYGQRPALNKRQHQPVKFGAINTGSVSKRMCNKRDSDSESQAKRLKSTKPRTGRQSLHSHI